MAATNKLLARRVDELSDALVKVHERVTDTRESEDINEVTDDALAEIVEFIDNRIGPEDTDQDSEGDEEESEEEPDEEPEEEE